MARGASFREAMTARLPAFARAKVMAASTFGSMEPGANWPSRHHFSASSAVISEIPRSVGRPKSRHTLSTAVRIKQVLRADGLRQLCGGVVFVHHRRNSVKVPPLDRALQVFSASTGDDDILVV